jgi:hypothetical protein
MGTSCQVTGCRVLGDGVAQLGVETLITVAMKDSSIHEITLKLALISRESTKLHSQR